MEKERERLKAKDDAEIDGEYEEDRDEFLEEYGVSDGYSADYDGRGYSDDYHDGRSAPVDYDDYNGGHYSRSRRGRKK